MGFVTDLKQWEEMETRVAEVLTEYFWQTVSKNSDKKGVDLIVAEWLLLIEVKFDRMVGDTGNYAFEFKCNWKESWIAKQYSSEEWWKIQPHFLVQAHSEWFELYHTYKLLKYVEEHKDRTVKGGDGWRSEMQLIKRDAIKELIIKEFKF